MLDDPSPLSIESTCTEIKHWKASPFAIGQVSVTWEEQCTLEHCCCSQQSCREDVDATVASTVAAWCVPSWLLDE